MSNKHYVGLDLVSFSDNGKYKPVSRVTLLIDDENSVTSGDDTGMELVSTCHHATQAMADALLAQFKGYEYSAFEAVAANLDPAAELGDGITADGHYSVISRLSDNGDGYPSPSAPGEAEMEEEYPSAGPMTQEINRKIAQTNSRITKTAEEIRLEVQGLGEKYTSLSVTLDGVTITDDTGTTRIKGSSIETDTLYVDAAHISGTLLASQINLTGAITFNELSPAVTNDINDAWSMAYAADRAAADASDTVEGWRYGSTAYMGGSMLMIGTVRASSLEGGSVALLTSAEYQAGVMTITGANTANYAVDLTSYGALRLTAEVGAVGAYSGYGTSLLLADGEIRSGGGDFRPASSNNYSCGTASWYWTDVYAANATIQTSDRNKKTDIVYGLDMYDALFDGLRPVSFLFKDGTSGRRHPGLIAQDVEELLGELDMSGTDFSAFIKSVKRDEEGNVVEGEYEYALRYGELIPLCIDQIQKLKQRVTELEAKV